MVTANGAERAELIKEIDGLPEKHVARMFDFMKYLQREPRDEDEVAGYKAMAADTEREREARQWCGSYFGPARKQ